MALSWWCISNLTRCTDRRLTACVLFVGFCALALTRHGVFLLKSARPSSTDYALGYDPCAGEIGPSSGRGPAVPFAAPRLKELASRALLVLATGSFDALRGLRRTVADALAMGTIPPWRRNIFRDIVSSSVAAGIESILSRGGQLRYSRYGKGFADVLWDQDRAVALCNQGVEYIGSRPDRSQAISLGWRRGATLSHGREGLITTDVQTFASFSAFCTLTRVNFDSALRSIVSGM